MSLSPSRPGLTISARPLKGLCLMSMLMMSSSGGERLPSLGILYDLLNETSCLAMNKSAIMREVSCAKEKAWHTYIIRTN